jgi:hypothetical protein
MNKRDADQPNFSADAASPVMCEGHGKEAADVIEWKERREGVLQ